MEEVSRVVGISGVPEVPGVPVVLEIPRVLAVPEVPGFRGSQDWVPLFCHALMVIKKFKMNCVK